MDDFLEEQTSNIQASWRNFGKILAHASLVCCSGTAMSTASYEEKGRADDGAGPFVGIGRQLYCLPSSSLNIGLNASTSLFMFRNSSMNKGLGIWSNDFISNSDIRLRSGSRLKTLLTSQLPIPSAPPTTSNVEGSFGEMQGTSYLFTHYL